MRIGTDLHRRPGSSWKDALLVNAITDPFRKEVATLLKSMAHKFLDTHSFAVTPAEQDAADRWYVSLDGQETLSAFARLCWAQMDAFANHAMPAHDRRHAMIKVPSSALEYIQSEPIQGFERVGLLGALLHDQGRWGEERIFGGPQKGPLHARMSFVLAQELLDPVEMPAMVKRQILLAILRHPTGAEPPDPMPLKLTVTADRDQLYGPEIVLRLLHAAPRADGGLSAVYGGDGRWSVLDELERFQRNRLPGPLFSMARHVSWLQWVQRVFILMVEPHDASRKRFEIDIVGSSAEAARGKHPLRLVDGSPFDWEASWSEAAALCPAAADAREELAKLFESRNLAPSDQYKAEALKKLDSLEDACRPLIAGGLRWVREQLRANDERQEAAIRKICGSPATDLLTTTIGELILENG